MICRVMAPPCPWPGPSIPAKGFTPHSMPVVPVAVALASLILPKAACPLPLLVPTIRRGYAFPGQLYLPEVMLAFPACYEQPRISWQAPAGLQVAVTPQGLGAV